MLSGSPNNRLRGLWETAVHVESCERQFNAAERVDCLDVGGPSLSL